MVLNGTGKVIPKYKLGGMGLPSRPYLLLYPVPEKVLVITQ